MRDPTDDTISQLRVIRGGKKRFANHLTISTELRRHSQLAGFLAHDGFAHQIILRRPIPDPNGESEADFEPRPLRDEDASALAAFLNAEGFRRAPIGVIRDTLPVVARTATFHPVRAFLEALTWDGTHRMGRLFFDHCGVVCEAKDAKHAAYIEAVSRCFFISAVARIFEVGCKVDHILVLEGRQGIEKSRLLRALAVNDDWFSDSLPHNLESKDARSHLSGKWLIEMSELSQFRGSTIETLKSFLTCQHDKFRPSYGRNDVTFKRQCVFVGSTNSKAYLHDPTGNRRFWPVELTAINLAAIRPLVPQLWAEAVHEYQEREKWWLPPGSDLEKAAAEIQAGRYWRDPWYDAIATFVARQKDGFTTTSIFAEIEKEIADRTRGDEMRIADVLTELGCEHRKRKLGGKSVWAWRSTRESGQ